MLQDEGDDHLTRALGLNACYNFYLTATEEDYKNPQEEDEDEDIVNSSISFEFLLKFMCCIFRLK